MADSVITITIPEAVAPEVIAALCVAGDWTPDDGEQEAFAKTVIIRYVKQVTINSRMAGAGNTAKDAAEVAATTDLTNIT